LVSIPFVLYAASHIRAISARLPQHDALPSFDPGKFSPEKDYRSTSLSNLDLIPPLESPQRNTLPRIFVGGDSLRAGWSLLLFFLLVACLIGAARSVVMWLHLPLELLPADAHAPLRPRLMGLVEALSFAALACPAFLMSLIERRPFGRYGLSAAHMLPDFLAGLFWGFAALSLLVGALRITHGIAFDGVLLHGAAALVFALKWAAVFFLVGLFEEFFFRGYLQYTLARGFAGFLRFVAPDAGHAHAISFWLAACLLSVLLFVGAHTGNGGENFVGLFQVGLAGAVFAFSLYRTGTLWWGIGLHTAWDWAQSYFYGTPDSGNLVAGHLLGSHPIGSKLLSGGPDGPEGSVLGIPTLLLVALVIHLTLPKREYPVTPSQS
jgi:membrane protease YdiL (CAAX protease family)